MSATRFHLVARLTAPVAAIVFGVSAATQSLQSADWQLCTSSAAGDAQRAVQGCSHLLAATSLKPKERAVAYSHRGASHLRLGNHDLAISDFDAWLKIEPKNPDALRTRGLAYIAKGNAARAVRDLDAAIRIAPNDAEAFNLRGDAAVRMGDLTRALEDYSAAVRLNPFYGLAFRNRGRVYFYRGDFAAAAEDFRIAAGSNRANGYSLLWYYVAGVRAGVNDKAGLEQGVADLRDEWPKPLALHFLGRTGEAEVLAAAAADPQAKAERECEAHFFLGQKHLLDGANAAAIGALRQALAVCPRQMVESGAARVELQRLGVASP